MPPTQFPVITNLGSPVSAGLGEANTVGKLSVPMGWARRGPGDALTCLAVAGHQRGELPPESPLVALEACTARWPRRVWRGARWPGPAERPPRGPGSGSGAPTGKPGEPPQPSNRRHRSQQSARSRASPPNYASWPPCATPGSSPTRSSPSRNDACSLTDHVTDRGCVEPKHRRLRVIESARPKSDGWARACRGTTSRASRRGNAAQRSGPSRPIHIGVETASPLRLNVVSETKRCPVSVVVGSLVMMVRILLMSCPLVRCDEHRKGVQLFTRVVPAFLARMLFPRRPRILTALSSTTSLTRSLTSRKGNNNVFTPLAGQANRPHDD